MNQLQSSIRRDGIKVHYLNIQEAELYEPSSISLICHQVKRFFLHFGVSKTNKSNKHRKHYKLFTNQKSIFNT
jgi:hypothetical protein